MLLDPGTLLDEPLLLAATLAVILIGKPLAALAIVRAVPLSAEGGAVGRRRAGADRRVLVHRRLGGHRLGVLTADATNILVAAAIVSITLNPLLFRGIGWVERWLTRGAPAAEAPASAAALRERARAGVAHRAVVVGYGPVGRTVTRLLRENDIAPTIIEMNLDTVREVRKRACTRSTATPRTRPSSARPDRRGARLHHRGVAARGRRRSLPARARPQPRHPHPGPRHARARGAPLRGAGADVVFSGEGEVALAFTTAILGDLGATPDQIDRERSRVRGELA